MVNIPVKTSAVAVPAVSVVWDSLRGSMVNSTGWSVWRFSMVCADKGLKSSRGFVHVVDSSTHS